MGSWITLTALLVLASFVDSNVMMWVVAPFVVLSLLNKDKLTAEYLEIPNTIEIFERSWIWKAVAIAYIAILLVSVGYHFAVERLSIFENAGLASMFFGIFAPVLGPIVVGQVEAFRKCGDDNGKS